MNFMGADPVLHARAGLEAMLSPPFTPSQLKKSGCAAGDRAGGAKALHDLRVIMIL